MGSPWARKLEVRAPAWSLGTLWGNGDKVGPEQLGGLRGKSRVAQREFPMLGAEAKRGKGAAHGIWGYHFKGEVGPEMGAGSRGSGHHKSLPVQQEGILVQGGEGD